MINKKNLLGKTPDVAGIKDAVHTAIVSVRAGCPIAPGQRCGLNEFNEAVPNPKGPGVADPFLKNNILTGQMFWLLLCQTEVPNVTHVWEHPNVNFDPPTREVKKNSIIEQYAKDFGVTYEQLIQDIATVVKSNNPVKYSGNKVEEELEELLDEIDLYDLWSEWADETMYKFANDGTDCCPVYDFPRCLYKI